MPLPKHVFNPPFNIVRSSHVVLGVTDLDRSLAFYEETLGLHRRGPQRGRRLAARGRGAAASLAGAEEIRHAGLRADRLQGRERGRSRQGRGVFSRRAGCGMHSSRRPIRAAPCRSPTRSACRSSSTSRWKSASACCSSTAAIRACMRSGSTISTSSRRNCRTRSISTRCSASA